MKEDQYEDIINLSYHGSTKHAHMSNYERAAQFSPFAALKGFDEEIEKTEQRGDEETDFS